MRVSGRKPDLNCALNLARMRSAQLILLESRTPSFAFTAVVVYNIFGLRKDNKVIMENVPAPKKDAVAASAEVKACYERFLDALAQVKREHRGKIDAILKTIDERKIKDFKEKLKDV